MRPSNSGSPLTRQYDGASAVTTNSSVAARLTRRDRMSTSGLSDLGDPAAVVARVDERLGIGAGQARADDPGAEDDHRPGERPPPGG